MKQVNNDFVEETSRTNRRSLSVSPQGLSGPPSLFLNSPHHLSQTPIHGKQQNQTFFSSERMINNGDKSPNLGPANDQLSEKSDEEQNNQAVNNFMTFFRGFRVRRRMNAFLSDIASRRYKRLTKHQFRMVQDVTSHYKVSRQQLLVLEQQKTLQNKDGNIEEKNNNPTIILLEQNFLKRMQSMIRRFCDFISKQIIHRYKINKILHKIPLFDYQSNKKVFWDILYCFCSLLFYFSVPLHVSFNMRLSDVIQVNMLIFSWFIVLFHILISLNTCYYEKGLLVNQRAKIFHHYVQKSFLTDLFSFLPLTIIMGREINKSYYGGDDPIQIILSCFFIFKIFQFQKVLMGIEERFHLNNRLTYMIQLCKNQFIKYYFQQIQKVKLLFYLLFIVHILSCLWIYLGILIIQNRKQQQKWNTFIYLGRNNAQNQDNSWLITRGVANDVWQVQYLQGFYFVTVTMISVGYGDIVPQSSSEIILCIIIMFISCFVFAYSVNMIGEIINSIQMQDNIVKQQVRIIGGFMAKNNINQNLRQQIRIYLEYYQRQFSEQNEKEEQKIIGHLSENLKNTLMIEANKFILKDSPIFSKYFCDQVIEKMVSIIKEYRCTPEQYINQRFLNQKQQIIYQRNEKEDPKIYFIKSGLVEISASRTPTKPSQIMTKTPVKVLKQGESFGEYQFFTGSSNNYSARSLEFSRILYISRKEFLEIIKQYPLDYEKFCYIKDKIAFLNDASGIKLKCYICDSSRHSVEHCSIPHLQEDTYKVVKQQHYLGPLQERQEFQRSDQKCSWQPNLEAIREHAWQLQDDNESYIENASWMSWDSDSYIPSDDEKFIQNQFEENNMNFQGYNNFTHMAHMANNNLMQSQRITKHNYDFDNLLNERKQSDPFREHRKQMNRQINHEQNNSQSNTPPDQLKMNKNTTPLLQSRHLFMMRQSQMLNHQMQNNLHNKTDDQNQYLYERKETGQSVKKKMNINSSNHEQQVSSSPKQPTPKTQLNNDFHIHQIQLMKMMGKSDINNFQNAELHQQEVMNAQGNIGKQSLKLSNFNSSSPQHLNFNQNPQQVGGQINNIQMFPQQVVANLQNKKATLMGQQIIQGLQNVPGLYGISGIQGLSGMPGLSGMQSIPGQSVPGTPQVGGNNNQTLNLAELIQNQLMMNNKNNQSVKENDEDTKKIYEFYFKHNNYPNVLKKYNKPILKLIKVLQKSRLKKRKNQSFVRQNSKTNSLVQSNHSINLHKNSSSHYDKKDQSEQLKKSYFQKGQNDTILTDSINQSVKKSENKISSPTQFLTINVQSKQNPSNHSIVPLSPTSSEISLQTPFNGTDLKIPFNNDKNLDDNSVVSYFNNKLSTIPAIDENLNKGTQNTQYFETGQINSTQNDHLLTNHQDGQDRLSNQIQIFKQKQKQRKSFDVQRKDKQQVQVPNIPIKQETKENQDNMQITDLNEEAINDQMLSSHRQLINKADLSKSTSPSNSLFKQQAQAQFQAKQNSRSPRNSKVKDRFDHYLKHNDSNFTTIEEKTQENIHTQLNVVQQDEFVKKPIIRQITDRKSKNIEDYLANVPNTYNNKEFAKILQYQENTKDDDKSKPYKIQEDQSQYKQSYLKVDSQKYQDKRRPSSPDRVFRPSVSLKQKQKEANYKTLEKQPSIEKTIQQNQGLDKNRKRSDRSANKLSSIGEEKGFMKQQTLFNPSSQADRGKKMSIRRYSRAYNMALFKRQSTNRDSALEFLASSEDMNNKISANCIQKSIPSISSSSSSSRSSNFSPDQNFYQPFSTLQINSFRFEME